ncbi:protein MIZU-KUSSEI 1-like [Euphorbia lathyris]|uniref:protein MIZU-KUSSEI 1-like n=1 Tax=Euphorbia lathyris TaxID=212925 RepID=UPI003313E285
MTYQTITNGVTTVDCQKQVRSWRILRSLIHLLIPTCNTSNFIQEQQYPKQEYQKLTSSVQITGTIFGFRRGRVSFCIQTNSKSNPILLLEFAVPTAVLAREMQTGVLRIALECSSTEYYSSNNNNNGLLSMPLWSMYCNGKKSGYAVKRKASKVDMEALKLLNSVEVGAGTISGKELKSDDELMYLRANFARVSGSSQAQSFHLIDPDGGIGQELSISFFRSK